MLTWYSVDADDTETQERLAAAWGDAPVQNLETCAMLLEVAAGQVWAFTPESEDDEGEPVAIIATGSAVPARLVYAQLQQAVNLWNAGRVSSSGDVGMDSFTYTPRPLDKTIRLVIRPTKGCLMSDDLSVRDWIKAQLEPILPPTWKINKHQSMPGTISAVTVILKYTSIAKLPEAKRSWLANEVVLTVVDPHTDQDRGEDALDDEVLELVTALDSIHQLVWTDAKKVQVGPYLGWDITLQVNSRKTPPADPDAVPVVENQE